MHFGIGGDKWICQFIYGFPTVGSFSQEGVPPHPTNIGTQPQFLPSGNHLFSAPNSARASGFLRDRELWGEALPQVKSGWLSDPLPFSDGGDCPFFSLGATDAAFRFGVAQWKKLRPCDDLRHNLANLGTAILTPITLPTWAIFLKLLGKSTRPIVTGILLRAITRRPISSYPSTPPTQICLRWPSANRTPANGWLSFLRYYFSGPFLRRYATTASLGD